MEKGLAEIAKNWALDIRKKNPQAAKTMDKYEARVCSENAFRDQNHIGRYTNIYLQTDHQIEDVVKTCKVLVSQYNNLNIALPEPSPKIKQPITVTNSYPTLGTR